MWEAFAACWLREQLDSSPGPGLEETVAAVHGAMAARDGWVHGEREMAARHASDALVIAAGMDWWRVRQRLGDLRGRMQGDPLPAARDFVERYRILVRE